MDERAYSRPIDVHRISEYPEVQRVISFLLTKLKDSSLLGKSPGKKILKHLKAVVLDLYIGYPRAKSQYSRESSGTVVLWLPSHDESGQWLGDFGLPRVS